MVNYSLYLVSVPEDGIQSKGLIVPQSYFDYVKCDDILPVKIELNATYETLGRLLDNKKNRKPISVFINTMLPYSNILNMLSAYEDLSWDFTYAPDLTYQYQNNKTWFLDISNVAAYSGELERVKNIINRSKKEKRDMLCVCGILEQCAHLYRAIEDLPKIAETVSDEELKVLYDITLPLLQRQYKDWCDFRDEVYNDSERDVYTLIVNSSSIIMSRYEQDDLDLFKMIPTESSTDNVFQLDNRFMLMPETINDFINDANTVIIALLMGFKKFVLEYQ